MNYFFSITLTLFLVIDAFGNIPVYLSLLKPFEKKQQRYIALRELFFALILMILFHFLGQLLLLFLHVSPTTVKVAGGIILFLIAIRLIFSNEEEKPKWVEKQLFIFPIATPLFAGPTVLAAITIFSQNHGSRWSVLGAIFIAWFFSSLILFFAKPIHQLLKDKGLLAFQRLMGLIVAIIAVQLFLEGIEGLIQK